MIKKLLFMSVFVLAECNAMEDNNNTQVSFPDKVLFNIFCQAGEVVQPTQAIATFKAIQLTCKLGTNELFVQNFEDKATSKYKAIKRRIKFIRKDIKHAKLEKKYAKQYQALHEFDDRKLEEMAFSSYRDKSVQSLEERYEEELDRLYKQQENLNNIRHFFDLKRDYDYFMELKKEKANRNK